MGPKSSQRIKKGWDILNSRTAFVVGNGTRWSFERMDGMGMTLVCVLSFLVCSIIIQRHLGGRFLGCDKRVGSLDLHFSRHFNDWELGIVRSFFIFIFYYLFIYFFLRLQDKFMERKDIEKMIWKESRNEVFFYQFPFLQSFSRIYRSWIKWIFLLGKLVGE